MSRRTLSTALIALGSAITVFGLLTDLLGIGHGAGIGTRQLMLAGAGVLLAAAGFWLAPARRRWLARATSPPITPGATLLLAATFGLLTGLIEAAHQAFIKVVLGEVLWQPVDVVYGAPLLYLAMFLVFGAVLILAGRVWRSLASLPIVAFALAMLAAWSAVRHPIVINLGATLDRGPVLVLAIAIAIKVAASARARPAAWLRAARRAAPIMLAIVALTAAAVIGLRRVAEARALAALPPAEAGAPNVLLIVMDTVRAENLPTYGYERDTAPTVDRLAQNGVVFNRSIVTAPWTLPSHATLFTGRYPHEMSADFRAPLDGEHTTLAEVLARHGYVTGGFVGNLAFCQRERGIARGFSHYEDFQLSFGVLAWMTGLGSDLAGLFVLSFRQLVRNDADTVTGEFLDWLPSTEGRPFFAFLNYFDAHALYLQPPPYDTLYPPKGDELLTWAPQPELWSEADVREMINAYDGGIRRIDDHIAIVLDALREAGRLDDTLVVVTADHGEQFREHELMYHANSLYLHLTWVPTVLSFPGRLPAGHRVTEPVSHRDLPATILDLIGVHPEGGFPGHSLVPLWDPGRSGDVALSPVLSEVSQNKTGREFEPPNRGPLKALLAEGMHYIAGPGAEEQLYDLRADPGETHNLIGAESVRNIEVRLRRALRHITADPPATSGR